MKKIIITLAAGIFLLQSCNKDYDTVSQVKTVSYPTVNFSGLPYYSINVGGDVPNVVASAYDSTLREVDTVSIVGTDAIDNTTPGLYIISARATNSLGFYTLSNVYVAVTDIPANANLSGKYKRTDVSTGDTAYVQQLARGLYYTDNIAGANRVTRPDLLFQVLFVHVDDTTIILPVQETAAGTITVKDTLNRVDMVTLRQRTGDTTYKYAIIGNAAFGTALRTFKKY